MPSDQPPSDKPKRTPPPVPPRRNTQKSLLGETSKGASQESKEEKTPLLQTQSIDKDEETVPLLQRTVEGQASKDAETTKKERENKELCEKKLQPSNADLVKCDVTSLETETNNGSVERQPLQEICDGTARIKPINVEGQSSKSENNNEEQILNDKPKDTPKKVEANNGSNTLDNSSNIKQDVDSRGNDDPSPVSKSEEPLANNNDQTIDETTSLSSISKPCCEQISQDVTNLQSEQPRETSPILPKEELWHDKTTQTTLNKHLVLNGSSNYFFWIDKVSNLTLSSY